MVVIRIAGGWMYRMRRVLATLCIGLLVVLAGYKVVFGANGMLVYRAKRAEFQELQQKLDAGKLEHKLLEQKVKSLQEDPKAIEREAREQLGYVKPGEVVLVEPQKRDAKAASSVAEKAPEKP